MGGYEMMEGIKVMEVKKYTKVEVDEANEKGYCEGHDDGHDEGYEEGIETGQMEGHDEGYDEGYEVGYKEGYDAGKSEGIFETENKYHEQGFISEQPSSDPDVS